DGIGHARRRAGHDRVTGNPVFGERVGTAVGQPENAGLGGRVIGLPRRAQRRTGREVNNPTALLLAHQGRRRTDGAEVALQVYSDHRVPLFLGHVEDHAVAQDAGAVHQNVELPEGIDRRLDQTLSAFDGGDVVGIGYGLAAGLLDFLHDLLGRSFVRPFTVDA